MIVLDNPTTRAFQGISKQTKYNATAYFILGYTYIKEKQLSFHFYVFVVVSLF